MMESEVRQMYQVYAMLGLMIMTWGGRDLGFVAAGRR